jgi:hypothetical protein
VTLPLGKILPEGKPAEKPVDVNARIINMVNILSLNVFFIKFCIVHISLPELRKNSC